MVFLYHNKLFFEVSRLQIESFFGYRKKRDITSFNLRHAQETLPHVRTSVQDFAAVFRVLCHVVLVGILPNAVTLPSDEKQQLFQ